MSSLRKKAMVRLLLCALVLIATIVFCFLLLTGTFDGSSSGTSEPASTSESVPASDSTESTDSSEPSSESEPADVADSGDGASSDPASESTAEPTPTPEPATFDGLSEQPATVYAEGEQPTYTVTPDSNMNMRAGPGTDFDRVAQVPAGTTVTALGCNADDTWVVVEYEGTYGWLTKEFLNAA